MRNAKTHYAFRIRGSRCISHSWPWLRLWRCAAGRRHDTVVQHNAAAWRRGARHKHFAFRIRHKHFAFRITHCVAEATPALTLSL